MTPKRALLVFAAWFGLGFGFARTIPTAHACSCVDESIAELSLASIDGDGDGGFVWPQTGRLVSLGGGTPDLYLGEQFFGIWPVP